MQQIGCLGPHGSFSEESLAAFLTVEMEFNTKSLEIVTFSSIPKLLRACDKGEIPWGFVPLENSIEGQVGATLDALVQAGNLFITREFNYPVNHCLLTSRSLHFERITHVLSHEQALGQCREYLENNLPNARQIVCSSTAEAAQKVASSPDCWAAIAPRRASELYGLNCQGDYIQDCVHNETRFILVGHQLPELSGKDKTSLLIKTNDTPGALCKVLNEFSVRQINLTRIESRPSKQKLGEYVFFIDVDGHVFSHAIQEVLGRLQESGVWVKLLGAFPKA